MSTFAAAIGYVLESEGGFSCDPNDPGGATDFGISLYWLKSLGQLQDADLNHDGRVDIDDIRALTPAEAQHLYEKYWWDHYAMGQIASQRVATKLFDTAVNMGGIPAIKMAQTACTWMGASLAMDGRMGPNTILAINAGASKSEEAWLRDYANLQRDRYQLLTAKNPKLLRFIGGWLKRAARLPAMAASA